MKCVLVGLFFLLHVIGISDCQVCLFNRTFPPEWHKVFLAPGDPSWTLNGGWEIDGNCGNNVPKSLYAIHGTGNCPRVAESELFTPPTGFYVTVSVSMLIRNGAHTGDCPPSDANDLFILIVGEYDESEQDVITINWDLHKNHSKRYWVSYSGSVDIAQPFRLVLKQTSCTGGQDMWALDDMWVNMTDAGRYCNEFGNCVSDDSCTCTEPGVTGESCDVCDLNALCEANNTDSCSLFAGGYQCLCKTDFRDRNCSEPFCTGYWATDTGVCNYEGTCESPHICDCNADYSGNDCETCDPEVFCGNVSGAACANSRAAVVLFPTENIEECTCPTGYGGINCEFIECNSNLAVDGIWDDFEGAHDWVLTQVEVKPSQCDVTPPSGTSTVYFWRTCAASPRRMTSRVFSVNGNTDIKLSMSVMTHGLSCLLGATDATPLNVYYQGIHLGDESTRTLVQTILPSSFTWASIYNRVNMTFSVTDHFVVVIEQATCGANYYDVWQIDDVQIEVTSVAACTNQGDCTPGGCSCYGGFNGNDCENCNTTAMCSDRASSCNILDGCECDAGFTGDACEKHICNGRENDDPTVCNGAGTCFVNFTCGCDPYFSGADCGTCDIDHFCSGSERAAECNQRGVWSDPYAYEVEMECVCLEGWHGIDCSVPMATTTIFETCDAPGETLPDWDLFNVMINDDCLLRKIRLADKDNNNTVDFIGDGAFRGLSLLGWVPASPEKPANVYMSMWARCGAVSLECGQYPCEDSEYAIHGAVIYQSGNPKTDIFMSPIDDEGSATLAAQLEQWNLYEGNLTDITEPFSVQIYQQMTFGTGGGTWVNWQINDITVDFPPGPCSGFGDCVSPDNCTCDLHYTGENCQECDIALDCAGFNLTNVERCTNEAGSHICECNLWWEDPFCNVYLDWPYICHGKTPIDVTNCNGNGNCSGWDTCSCFEDHHGPLCEFCNITTVCNGNAWNCTSFAGENSTCFCDVGWQDDYCGTVDCGVNDCDGNGACTGPMECTCTPGWTGATAERCDEFWCYGYLPGNPDRCNRQGNCEGPNNCSCLAGFSGEFCEVCTVAAGGCSSPGTLSCANNMSVYTCTCDTFFNGSLCENDNRPLPDETEAPIADTTGGTGDDTTVEEDTGGSTLNPGEWLGGYFYYVVGAGGGVVLLCLVIVVVIITIIICCVSCAKKKGGDFGGDTELADTQDMDSSDDSGSGSDSDYESD